MMLDGSIEAINGVPIAQKLDVRVSVGDWQTSQNFSKEMRMAKFQLNGFAIRAKVWAVGLGIAVVTLTPGIAEDRLAVLARTQRQQSRSSIRLHTVNPYPVRDLN